MTGLGTAELVGASTEKRRVMGQDGERLSFLSSSLLPQHVRSDTAEEGGTCLVPGSWVALKHLWLTDSRLSDS